MQSNSDISFPTSGINKHIYEYIRSLPDLTGKTVLDIPCGDGRASNEFYKKNAKVIPMDLFPEFFKIEGHKASYADLSEKIPLEDNSVDYICCQEGIEHIPAQLWVLNEFNRVLKQNGILILTTPNNSSARARFSTFCVESDLPSRMPPTELDGVWFAKAESKNIYYGHLFLLTVQHLETLLSISGFKTTKRIKTDISVSALIIGVILFPIIAIVSMYSYFQYSKKKLGNKEKQKAILWNRLKLNLSVETLFCRHIFWVCQKQQNLNEVVDYLKSMQRTE